MTDRWRAGCPALHLPVPTPLELNDFSDEPTSQSGAGEMKRIEFRRTHRTGGFTLTELMITVALIGTLASVAIPNFLTYQARTRRSEAFTTLSGIAASFVGFHAESGYYPDMRFETGGLTNLPDVPLANLGTTKSDWSTAQAYFDLVGFRVDGKVWHTYDVSAPSTIANLCTVGAACANCFTIAAHGDTDSDTNYGAVVYVHPERNPAGVVTGECQSAIFNYTAPLGALGPVYDEPVVHSAGDQY